MGLDSGKHGVAYGRHESRRDYYQSDRSDHSASSRGSENSSAKGPKSVRFSEPSAAQTPAMIELEKKLSGLQKDFAQQLQTISEKETEKFDLIFAILTDLQSGQAQLEESIRDIKKHATNSQMVCVPMMMPSSNQQFMDGQQPPQQFNSNSNNMQQFGQLDGVIAGQEMGTQQPMQGPVVMQPDGSQMMMVAVPQAMVVQSPTGVMMQPMMMPANGQMTPMQPQMAMQFMGPGGSPVQQDVTGGFPTTQAALETEQDGENKDASKNEGSDIDSADTPTTASALSE